MPGKRWWPQARADRRFVTRWMVVVMLAALVATVAGVLTLRAGSGDADPAERAAVEAAAADAVTGLMTFAPDDTADQRALTQALLSGSLAADYAGRGPDVVFAGALASRITMAVVVADVGVVSLDGPRARALVFADQTVTVDGDEPQRLGVSRWATMVKSDGHWRLARLEPVVGQ